MLLYSAVFQGDEGWRDREYPDTARPAPNVRSVTEPLCHPDVFGGSEPHLGHEGNAAGQRYGHGADPVEVVQRCERTGRFDRGTAPAGLITKRHDARTQESWGNDVTVFASEGPLSLLQQGAMRNIEVNQCPTQQFCRVMFFAESVAGEGQASVAGGAKVRRNHSAMTRASRSQAVTSSNSATLPDPDFSWDPNANPPIGGVRPQGKCDGPGFLDSGIS
jgi:hypothetical protein